MPDGNTDYVKDVKEKFNIEVIFSSRSKLHSSLILVKGSEQDAKNVCHATEFLIIHMYQCNSVSFLDSLIDSTHFSIWILLTKSSHNLIDRLNLIISHYRV